MVLLSIYAFPIRSRLDIELINKGEYSQLKRIHHPQHTIDGKSQKR